MLNSQIPNKLPRLLDQKRMLNKITFRLKYDFKKEIYGEIYVYIIYRGGKKSQIWISPFWKIEVSQEFVISASYFSITFKIEMFGEWISVLKVIGRQF